MALVASCSDQRIIIIRVPLKIGRSLNKVNKLLYINFILCNDMLLFGKKKPVITMTLIIIMIIIHVHKSI